MNGTFQSLEPRLLFAVAGLPFKLGSATFDQGTKIVYTPDGGYIVGGLFGGTVDFDPSAGVANLTSVGDSDIFVARYTAASTLVWARQFGGDGMRSGLHDQKKFIDIAADPARGGGDFVNGYGDSPLNAGEYLNDLKVDGAGNVFFAGDFIETADFDPGKAQHELSTQNDEYYNGFVEKLDPNGNLTWVKQIAGRFTETASALAVNSADDVYVTGLFSRDVDFTVAGKTQTLHAQGRADGYILELNSAGSIQWINQFGGDDVSKADRDSGNDVTLDSAGNVYVVGAYAGDADFTSIGAASVDVASAKKTDGFLAKYTAAGHLRSVQTFGGKDYDGLTHVIVDSSGSAIISGYFDSDDFDADPGPAERLLDVTDSGEHKRTDSFVEKLAHGSVAWVQQQAGDGTEFIDGLAVDSAGAVYAIGSYYGTATLGRGLDAITSERGTSNFHDRNDDGRDDSYDAFLLKLSDASGSVLALKTFGSTGDDYGMGLSVGPDDSVLMTGRFRFDVDFDPGRAQRIIVGLGFGDVFVAGLTSRGTLLG